MAAAAGSTGGSAGALAQEQTDYWASTSPSSPHHVLRTAPHAFIALIGLGGFACFSYALIEQLLFDGIMAAVLVGVCLHIYTLQSERSLQKSKLPKGGLDGVSVFPNKPVASGAGPRSAVDGASELDLTGYAKTLGVSLRSGKAPKEGNTLNKILMDALAKEYLRCQAALRCYQTAFGPLPEDTPEEAAADPLSSTLNALRIPIDLEALGQNESRPQTPQSPAGLPSPDKRSKMTPERPQSQFTSGYPNNGFDETPAPAAPVNTPATAGPSKFEGNLQEHSHSSSEDTECSQVWKEEDAKKHFRLEREDEIAPKTEWRGLFGGSKHSI